MASPRLSAFRTDQLWRDAREPTFWFDRGLRLVWVNRAWEALTGYTADRVLGITSKLHSPIEAGNVNDLVASFHPPPRALAGKPAGASALILHVDGEKLWRQLEFWPFHDSRGDLIGFLGRARESDATPDGTKLETQELTNDLLELRKSLHRKHGVDSLIGQGDAHNRLLQQIRIACATKSPILIVGEPGTGKRLVARIIHEFGANPRQAIKVLDFEAIAVEQMESQLFGSVVHPGLTEYGSLGAPHSHHSADVAEPATLVVGDILLLPRDLQTRLVKFLHRGTSPRVMAMTAGDPEAALRSEQLRPDLYYSLTSLVIRLNPLRERLGDLMLLAQHFLERGNRRSEHQKSGFAANAQAALLAYDWPGNLTELDRVIQHAREVGDKMLISAKDLPASIGGNLGAAYLPAAMPLPFKPLDELLTEIERRLIENALVKARRNKTRAADLLGISRPRLYRRMKELNLEDETDAGEESGLLQSAED